jgi:glutathione synthase/RimK-type ligase-like ATP-grasp enzyme
MRLALASARAARALDEDLPPLLDAARRRGFDVEVLDWDDAAVDWSAFQTVLLRSTWDYTDRLPEFLAWAERVADRTRLLNPPSVLRWNTDKRYLLDLEAAGVPIIPTRFLSPEAPIDVDLSGDLVVKPSVGAGSRGARRFRDAPAAAAEHVRELMSAGRTVLIQPYLDAVDRDGETALIYFAGRFSHAIRKGPLLRPNGEATRALFAPEHITARRPSAAELRVAERALAAVPHPEPLVYARVDLLPDPKAGPRLLELELTEPSLFFAHGPGSTERLLDALAVGA